MKKISIILAVVFILYPILSAFSGNNYLNSPERIKKCENNFAIWREKINIGMTSTDFGNKFDSKEWIEQALFYEIHMIAGKVPVETDFESTTFRIYLYPEVEHKGWSDYVIYFRLNGKMLSMETGLSFLNGKLLEKNVTLLEYALCYSGETPQKMGKIERFTTNGKK